MNKNLPLRRPPAMGLAAWILGLAALATAPLAHASDDVYWSIGVSPAPGVAVGASNLPPVVYAPPRVVYAPPPVVYTSPRVVYSSPVYVMQPAYPHRHGAHPGHGHGHGHGHGQGHGKWKGPHGD